MPVFAGLMYSTRMIVHSSQSLYTVDMLDDWVYHWKDSCVLYYIANSFITSEIYMVKSTDKILNWLKYNTVNII